MEEDSRSPIIKVEAPDELEGSREGINLDSATRKCDVSDPCEWEGYFLNRPDCLVKNGVVNLHRTKVAVLSGTDIKHGDTDMLTILSGEEQLRNKARFEKTRQRYGSFEPARKQIK